MPKLAIRKVVIQEAHKVIREEVVKLAQADILYAFDRGWSEAKGLDKKEQMLEVFCKWISYFTNGRHQQFAELGLELHTKLHPHGDPVSDGPAPTTESFIELGRDAAKTAMLHPLASDSFFKELATQLEYTMPLEIGANKQQVELAVTAFWEVINTTSGRA